MAAKNHIELIVKTLAVLESLAQAEHGKALKDIASEVGLVKSSVFRILFTLREQGYVEQSEGSGIYRLTLKSGRLARRNTDRMRITDVARPHLAALRDELDESVALAERRAHSVVLVDVQETSHPLRLSFQIGDDCPVHATALGKAVAAFLSPQELRSMQGATSLQQYTERTKIKAAQFKSELTKTRENGYSLNDEETVIGAVLVGAPLFDASQIICGAISVNTPIARCTAGRRKMMIEAVIQAGKLISQDLADIGFAFQSSLPGGVL